MLYVDIIWCCLCACVVWYLEWEWPPRAHIFEYLVRSCRKWEGLEDVALFKEVCQWG